MKNLNQTIEGINAYYEAKNNGNLEGRKLSDFIELEGRFVVVDGKEKTRLDTFCKKHKIACSYTDDNLKVNTRRVVSCRSIVETCDNFFNKLSILDDLTNEEKTKVEKARAAAAKHLSTIDEILKAANERAAAAAKEAAQKERNRKRAAAATEKLKDSTTDEKLSYLKETAAALGIDLKTLLSMQTAAAV